MCFIVHRVFMVQPWRTLILLLLIRLSVNNLYDSSVEILAEEMCKYKIVEILG